MKRLEIAIFLVLLSAFGALFARATQWRYFTHHLDAAYFVESIDTTAAGKPETMLTRSVVRALTDVIVKPAEAVCAYPLGSDPVAYMSIYERHAFPVLYPLAALSLLTGSFAAFQFAAVLAFVGLLAAVYLVSRSIGNSPGLSAILTALAAAHPAWSYGAFGQMYPDKMFPPLCLLYLLLLYDWFERGRPRPWALAMVALIAASTSERSAGMIVAATLAVLALYLPRRSWRRQSLIPLGVAVGLAVPLYIYMRFVQSNADYVSFFSGVRNLLALRGTGADFGPTYKFLAIQALFLAPFGLGAWRWTLIAIGALIPNLLGNIGGAEKLGWSTHYHSAYFPFLVFAALAGARALPRWRWLRTVSAALALGAAGVLFFSNPFVPRPRFPVAWEQFRQTTLAQTVEFTTGTGTPGGLKSRAQYLQRVAASLPAGSRVSTVEGYMPALYARGVRWIHFYPLGVGAAEYLVLPYEKTPSGLFYPAHVSYLGPEVQRRADQCLSAIVNANYFPFQTFEDTPTAGTVVLRRRAETGGNH